MTSKSILLVLAFWMASQIIFPCSKQPAIPGTPPFCTEVLIYSLMRRYLVNLDAKTTKNIFPSTLRREIGRKWSMSFKFFSLGMYTPSAIIHWLLTWKFFHARFRVAWSQLRTLGHFLYKRKGIPFGSGVDIFLFLLTIRLISSRVGGFMLNLTLGMAGQTKLLLCSRGICQLESEYVSFKCFSRTFFSVLSKPDFG